MATIQDRGKLDLYTEETQSTTEQEKAQFRNELGKLLAGFEGMHFTKGSAPGESPDVFREVEICKVESWIQVPLILEKLAEGRNVRLDFPQPKDLDPSLTDPQQHLVDKEQGEISKFFAERQTKSLKEIETDLSNKIKDCFRFQQAAELFAGGKDLDLLKEEVAKNYRVNHSKKTAKSTSTKLAVSVVYEAKHLDDASQTAALIAEVVKHQGAFPKPKIIFDAGTNPAALQALASKLEQAAADPATKPLVEAITEVWAPTPLPGASATTPPANSFGYFVFRRDGFVQRYKGATEDTSVQPLKPEEYLPAKSGPVQDEQSLIAIAADWIWGASTWIFRKPFQLWGLIS